MKNKKKKIKRKLMQKRERENAKDQEGERTEVSKLRETDRKNK